MCIKGARGMVRSCAPFDLLRRSLVCVYPRMIFARWGAWSSLDQAAFASTSPYMQQTIGPENLASEWHRVELPTARTEEMSPAWYSIETFDPAQAARLEDGLPFDRMVSIWWKSRLMFSGRTSSCTWNRCCELSLRTAVDDVYWPESTMPMSNERTTLSSYRLSMTAKRQKKRR